MSGFDLSLDNFGDDFDLRTFVNRITAHISKPASQATDKDKKPTPSPQAPGANTAQPASTAAAALALTASSLPSQIKMIEEVLTDLQDLRREAEEEIQKGITDCKEAEEVHKDLMNKHSSQVEQTMKSFRRLDNRISKVSHTAVRIGHTLDLVDSQKGMDLKGKDTIQHFLNFNTGDPSKLAPIFRVTDDLQQLHEAARLIQMFTAMSLNVRVKGTDRAVKLIQDTSEQIENRLLVKFSEAKDRGDTTQMRECAQTLLNFMGRSVITRHVFEALAHLDTYYSVSDLEVRERNQKKLRAHMKKFYQQIEATCEKECQLCVQVFPNPVTVLKAIVDRIFSEKISAYLEAVVANCFQGKQGEEYLNYLSFAWRRTNILVESVQTMIQGVVGAKHTQQQRGADHISLRDQMQGVFAQYRQDYLAKELDVLTQQLQASIAKSLEAPEPEVGESAGGSGVAGEELLARLRKSKEEKEKAKKMWVLQRMDMQIVGVMLNILTASVKRCEILAEPQQVPESTDAIYSKFLTTMVDKYLKAVLKASSDFLPDPDPKVEPDPYMLTVVSLINAVTLAILDQYHKVVEVVVSPSSNTLTILEQRSREILGGLEIEVLKVLSRSLDAIIKWVTKLLAKQQTKRDTLYNIKPKDAETLLLAHQATVGPTSVVEFIEGQLPQISSCLEGKNLDRFLTALGTRLHSVISAHLKKFVINEIGAPLVAQDLKTFQAMIREFHIPALDALFEELVVMSNVFFVSVDNLRGLLIQGGDYSNKLAKVDVEKLHDFLKLRADYGQNKAKILSHLATVMSEAPLQQPGLPIAMPAH